jgi:hypothetical protein
MCASIIVFFSGCVCVVSVAIIQAHARDNCRKYAKDKNYNMPHHYQSLLSKNSASLLPRLLSILRVDLMFSIASLSSMITP